MHSFWLAQVSRPILDRMLQDLRDHGNTVEPMLIVPGPAVAGYSVQGSGITARVVYDPSNQRACVTIEEKPWLVPVSYIEQKVRESLKAAHVYNSQARG